MGWADKNPLNGAAFDAGTLARATNRAPTPACRVKPLDAPALHQKLRHFFASAERYGLPTGFLREVDTGFCLNEAWFAGDSVYKLFNVMNLTGDTVLDLQTLSTARVGGAAGVQTLYHESTHAWFQLKAKVATVAQVVRRGVEYYEGAPLEGGARADDAPRLFNEAAAGYVGHRAGHWWLCFQGLALLAVRDSGGPAVARLRSELRRRYNRAMSERVFGYQDTGGVLGVGSKQTETTRPISPDLKAFLDQTLLEGKVPDAFDAVEGFRRIIHAHGMH
jgi:hypothetical protein